MGRGQGSGTGCGCFRWVASTRKAINKRCAAARNAVIRCFRRDNPNRVSAEIVNEDGNPDLIFTKRPVSPKPVDASVVEEKPQLEDEATAEDAPQTTDAALDQETESPNAQSSVQDVSKAIVDGVVQKAQSQVQAEAEAVTSMTSSIVSDLADEAVKQSLTNIASEGAAEGVDIATEGAPEGSQSMTSSVISDLAEATVRTSLTNIGGNTNASASVNPYRAQRLSEIFDALGENYFDPKYGMALGGKD